MLCASLQWSQHFGRTLFTDIAVTSTRSDSLDREAPDSATIESLIAQQGSIVKPSFRASFILSLRVIVAVKLRLGWCTNDLGYSMQE